MEREQHFCSTSMPCKCAAEEKGACGEMRFGTVLCSTGRGLRESVGAKRGRLDTLTKWEKLKGEKKESRRMQKADHSVDG